ncbi:efflux RND transporter permease subunit [Alkalilacustris brevis]|uniref:efflux RND transporter permease subunit n=1 Tax=Alkalilacustris brevis TaxID=2026338 RepID=UPI000E0D92D3|nr:efflux RND transporter permease subunit [Alkalilacustris brevis]
MIRWFAGHPTAANLLLILLIAAGAVAAPGLVRETFPDFRPTEAEVSVAYRGAGAGDVEDAVCRVLWDTVQRVEDLAEFTCTAQDNRARAVATMSAGGDAGRFMEDLRGEVAAITDLPDRADPPVVRALHRSDFVTAVGITGEMPLEHLELYAAGLQDRLRALPGVADVTLSGFGARQYRIEVSAEVLRQHGLTLAGLARQIGAQSVDLPGGTLETSARDLRLRFTDERRSLTELESLVVVSAESGGELTLGQIARIDLAFDTPEARVMLDGARAAVLDIHKTSGADALRVLDAVAAVLEAERAARPQGLRLEIVQDMTSIIRDRLAMLVENGLIGLVLVIGVMSLFFRPAFAAWSAVALPVAMLGAVVAMAAFGLSLNMMTLVALLMAIGLVMDSAIVITDSIAEESARGETPLEAATSGVQRVLPGVVSSFLTTVAVFGPLSFLAGELGAVLEVLPVVLIAALAASLVQAFWILPRQLQGALARQAPASRFRQRFDRGFAWVRDDVVGAAADWAVRWRYLVIGATLVAMLGTAGFVAAGHLGREAMPDVEGDVLEARLLMPAGTPLAQTEAAVEQIAAGLAGIEDRLGAPQPGGAALVQAVQQRFGRNLTANESGPHVATVSADFLATGRRSVTLDAISAAWRAEIGDIPGAVALTVQEPGLGPQGVAIEYRLTGPDLDQLASAARALSTELDSWQGVYNTYHDLRPGPPELHMSLASGAHQLGLTAADVADQLRVAFLGSVVSTVRIGAIEHEIALETRQEDRDARDDLDGFTITLPDGAQVPFSTVATMTEQRGWSQINHVDGQRTVTVQASVDVREGNAQAITAAIARDALPAILEAHPGVQAAPGGQSAAFAETSASILRGFLIGLVGIYVILSYQFRSYLEPVIVMLTIPLAFLGVIWGHVLMGYDISMPSLVGGASLAGIVVNNSILLVQFIKAHVARGMDVLRAAGQASRDRFRAIVLSATTTIVGILPLLAETSTQAQTLKPLVIAVAFGLATSTLLVLILLPALYAMLVDMRRRETLHAPGKGQATDLPLNR